MSENKTQKNDPIKVAGFFITRLIFILSFAVSFINGDYLTSFQCVLALVLFAIKDIMNRKFNLEFPRGFELMIVIFIFASILFGEMNDFFAKVPLWDKALHTTSGFLISSIGFALIDLLNKNKKTLVHLSPFFEAMFAFCFSMTMLVIWEFFEFGMDYFFLEDMQADYFVNQFSSKIAYGTLKGTHITDITEVIIRYGGDKELVLGSYIDIGNKDTMIDLLVGAAGAFVFSIIGFFALKKSTGRAARVVESFVVRKKGEETIFETSELKYISDGNDEDIDSDENDTKKSDEESGGSV